MDLPEPETLLQEQIDYYRARAPEYDDWWLRTGQFTPDDEFGARWEAGKRELEEALAAFAPAGDVLEIAAGTGNLTTSLLRQPGVASLTALDSSPETLAIARDKIGEDERVRFVHTDVFAWRPPRRYDVVAFGFWLSHVPPGSREAFWRLVGDALHPHGRVFFIDNAVPIELAASEHGRVRSTPWSHTWVDAAVSVRTLSDGRAFRIVKRAWTPSELAEELAQFGWTFSVREHQRLFLSAVGHLT